MPRSVTTLGPSLIPFYFLAYLSVSTTCGLLIFGMGSPAMSLTARSWLFAGLHLAVFWMVQLARLLIDDIPPTVRLQQGRRDALEKGLLEPFAAESNSTGQLVPIQESPTPAAPLAAEQGTWEGGVDGTLER